MSALAESPNQTYSPRQNAVLECALKVLVQGGERALTTARIAREANCSKESLYKWFGDRDGLLAAVIGFQAAKVRVKDAGQGAGDPDAFRASLVVFARDLLTVLAGDVSLALNRLAIGQASREGSALGRLLLERGRRTIETRARSLLESGARAGHISGDLGEAYRVLYALVVRDSHVRLLLGDDLADDERDFATRADAAVDQFFRLHGADGKTGRAGPGPDNNS